VAGNIVFVFPKFKHAMKKKRQLKINKKLSEMQEDKKKELYKMRSY
jgi:hypothetical protein